MTDTCNVFVYDDIAVGDSASFSVAITEALVDDFARLSGDENPLHMDGAYAEQTQFKGRIAHGMIVGALFSRLIGMHLPGKYAVYLSQTLQFREAVMIGEEIVIRGTVSHKTDALKTITIKTVASDKADKKIFVQGEALVKLLQ
jgi:3-hydroxybutyryl-CoA dehydratase